MKHQVFFFLLITSTYSVYSMDVDVSKITKGQLLQAMTDYNFKLKHRYPNDYNPQPLGSLIIYLRGQKLSDDKKRDIIQVMRENNFMS